jgi:hypothetical protein
MTAISFDPGKEEGIVPSPCINVCKMNAQTGLCEGCFRTLDEIVKWGTATNEYKRAVWVEIEKRQHELF